MLTPVVAPFMAAAVCCGMVVGVTYGWNRLGRLPELGAHPRAKLAHELGGWSLTPPLMWAGAALLLLGLGVPQPVAVPVLAALTLTWLAASAGRLVALAAEVARVREETVGLVGFALAVTAWVWVFSGGVPSRLAVLGTAVVGLGIAERRCAPALDIAVRCRQIRSTGLRPVLVDDPAWRLRQVDVLPDRDSVCVRYAGQWTEGSLWVDLLPPGERHRPTERLTPGLWKGQSAGLVRYFTLVSGQRVRLEFDGGRNQDQEARRLAGRLRIATARELAELESG